MSVVYKEEDKEIVYLPPSEEILFKKSNDLIQQFIKYAKEQDFSTD